MQHYCRAGRRPCGQKGEASLVRWDVEGSALVAPLKVDTERLRLALELSHRRALTAGELTPMLELGVRHDSGHGENGTGLEVGAGLRYLLSDLGLTMEGRVRALALSGADYEEWAGELNVTLDPGLSREGLRLHLVSGSGEVASGVERRVVCAVQRVDVVG